MKESLTYKDVETSLHAKCLSEWNIDTNIAEYLVEFVDEFGERAGGTRFRWDDGNKEVVFTLIHLDEDNRGSGFGFRYVAYLEEVFKSKGVSIMSGIAIGTGVQFWLDVGCSVREQIDEDSAEMYKDL
jgi:GNAT superfamily N-acetyltransferase